jgi:hypothetical protein
MKFQLPERRQVCNRHASAVSIVNLRAHIRAAVCT